MKKSPTKLIAAKRIAVAVAAVCATMAMPAFAADDMKGLMDLLLKKGVITQQEYDQHIKAAEDAAENKAFKEKRLDSDVAKLNKMAEKNVDAGSVMKNGIGIQSADGKNTIQLTGRLHMDYRQYDANFASGSSVDPFQNKLDVRRARLGFKGQFQKDWKYEIVGTWGSDGDDKNGLSEKSTILDVAYADYAANPALQVRFGKFKMPFSLEQLTSSNNIDFMERSFANQVEGEFVPGKETGVMLFGSPVSGASYALAVSKGRANTSAIYDGVDTIARGTLNLAELMGNKDLITHIGVGYSKGTVSSFSLATKTDESRANSAFYTLGTVAAGSTRTRNGLEYAIAYEGFKVQGETFDIDYSGKSVKMGYNEILWNITGEKHNYSNSTGTFGWIKPNQAFTDKGGLGAWQVGVRASTFDGTDWLAGAKASAMTYGATWFVNDNVRVMLNYINTKFDIAGGVGAANSKITSSNALMMRTQVSF